MQSGRPNQPKRKTLRLQLLRGLRAVAAEPRYSNRSLRGASRSFFFFFLNLPPHFYSSGVDNKVSIRSRGQNRVHRVKRESRT